MAASDNANVMELWHHTCKTPAEVMYGGPYGFEPAFAIPSSDDDRHKFASYGVGAYFAKEAIYSHWYGHVFQGGPCNMILAEVLTGTSLDLGEAYVEVDMCPHLLFFETVSQVIPFPSLFVKHAQVW